MHVYKVNVSNIVIQLETEKEFLLTNQFHPFVSCKGSPNCVVKYLIVDAIPDYPREVLFKDYGYRVHRAQKGMIYRTFYDGYDALEPYGVSIQDSNKRNITVFCLRNHKQSVSEFANSFLHIGIEGVLFLFRRLFIHASCIRTEYGGILFSGPSGVGKTTQSDLWVKYRNARVINGDRPILSCDDGMWLGWGAPYAGSSKVYLNESCPITAVVMLKQATECSVRQLNLKEAFRAVWSGLTVYSWDKEFVSLASELTIQLITDIPVYELSCTPDEKAVKLLETTLRKDLRR